MSARRVGVVGAGHIGGSIALRLAPLERWDVVCVDADPVTAAALAARGLEVAPDVAALVPGCDLVVLAAPLVIQPSLVTELAAALRAAGPDAGRTVVIDVGSTQQHFHRAAAAALTPLAEHGVRWFGSHPMAGTERRGLDAADPDLFVGAAWVLTLPEGPGPLDVDALLLITDMIADCGGEIVVTDVAAHDRAVAAVSHLPHLLAALLATMAAEVEDGVGLTLAAGSLRDMTRVASSAPEFTAGLCVSNAEALTDVVDATLARLAELRRSLAALDEPDLRRHFDAGHAARALLPATAGGDGGAVGSVHRRIVDADATALRELCRDGSRILTVADEGGSLAVSVRAGTSTAPTTAG